MIAVLIGVVLGIGPKPRGHGGQPEFQKKKYRMRGYGGSPKKYTSLHPRQAAQGKRIVFIPGVGYRHVTPGKKRA